VLKELYIHLEGLVKGRLWLKVIIGMVLGVVAGVLLGQETGYVSPENSSLITSWLALPGNLFIRLVQMIMIPLIVSSVIQGIAGGEHKDELIKTGPKVALYFIITTSVAIVIGVITTLLIKPGNYINSSALLSVGGVSAELEVETSSFSLKAVPNMITDLLPDNPLASMVTGEMLSIVIFSIIVGIALLNVSDKTSRPLLDLLSSIQEICMTITKWAMKLAPYAVFGLICQITAMVGINTIAGLGMYILAVVVGLMGLVGFYILILLFVAKTPVRHFFSSAKELLLLAFSMASSAAVMPMSIKTAEEKLNVKPSVSRFIIPVGATINMDGTAAYQAISTIFLAQVYGLELGVLSIVLLVITTVAASIGTPSTPGAGVIVLATVLSSVGVPITGIALIIGVDRLLGMLRTAVNVTGDLTACMVFNSRLGEPADTNKVVELEKITS
jgi:Na+/H+-dicarboxylate symporter